MYLQLWRNGKKVAVEVPTTVIDEATNTAYTTDDEYVIGLKGGEWVAWPAHDYATVAEMDDWSVVKTDDIDSLTIRGEVFTWEEDGKTEWKEVEDMFDAIEWRRQAMSGDDWTDPEIGAANRAVDHFLTEQRYFTAQEAAEMIKIGKVPDGAAYQASISRYYWDSLDALNDLAHENGITPKAMQRQILEPLLAHGLPEEALDRYLAGWA